MAGFTGLILGASRGLKAGPKEITFIASIPQIAFSTMAVIGSMNTLFFYRGYSGEHVTILDWSMLIVSLIIGVCTVCILANLLASFVWSHLIRWNSLLFFTTIALVAAMVFCVEVMFVHPSDAFPEVLMVLLPIGLPCWMIACWIRVEKELEKLDDTPENEAVEIPVESCSNA